MGREPHGLATVCSPSLAHRCSGALPLPPDANPQRNLEPDQRLGAAGGQSGNKTLVLADSRHTHQGHRVKEAITPAATDLLGGWDRVVVLKLEQLGQHWQKPLALNDDRLEVLVIPPNRWTAEEKKGSIPTSCVAEVHRFSGLQYLRCTPSPAAQCSSQHETLVVVRLKNYVLLSPEAWHQPGRCQPRKSTAAVANTEPLALIEYWAVDRTDDGMVQPRLPNAANDAGELRVVTQATDPALNRPRKCACGWWMSMFGFEAGVVNTCLEGRDAQLRRPCVA